ncbi:MAG TPA: nitrilase-related carbon-nitrogen hydrolase [Bacteroidales bacterium]|jgi:predicted amidohydrolase|nr:nitrilase family protein [Bacteroidota bacterium]HJN06882.1 nitrilase-related carbon-nitrogen hydrolase [Bacteroidales bacterium]|tara:strand:+ start:1948 stop:2742 length:795 start_codon:yes stop_codon:yes gene_type:complete
MQDLKILAFQADLAWENPEKNRLEFEKRIDVEFDSHHLIILPETFTTGFPVDPSKYAEKINGPTISWMEKMASSYNTVITGSLLLAKDGKYANTLVWMCPDGTFELYEKRHVFSMGGEHEKISAGTKKLNVNLMGWTIRPMICYDLRFPVWTKNHFDEKNGFEYDLAIYIANWPAVRSYPWKTLLLARSIENQAYTIGLNRVGIDGPGNKYSGDSMIVDPKGMILEQGIEGQEQALSITLSHNDLEEFRNSFNVGLDWDSFTIE